MSRIRRNRNLAFRFVAVVVAFGLAALAMPVVSPASAGSNPLVRKTKCGYVEGKAVKGIQTNNKAWAWLGIPYAKPPVGKLRWKAPRDPAPWSGIRPAKTLPGPSAQFGNFILNLDYETFDKPVGSEDSLYLNVWSPRKTGGKRPVIFWIHGGANIIGESATPIYDGANFASENDIVFVSINYRLGQLGWFAAPALRTGDPLDDSGNFGTLDIIKALKWVHNNISAFGGDPKNVTIAGQSAGAWNVLSLLVSPLAKGLFQRALAQSGAPLSTPRKTAEDAANATIRKLIIKDGYASNDQEAEQFMAAKGSAWIAAYLRSKPAEDFMTPVSFSTETLNPLKMISIVGDGYVIPKSLLGSISSGNYTKVPTILSSTRDELKFFLPLIIGTKTESEFAKSARDVDINSPNFQAGNTGASLKEFLDPAWWPFYNPVAQSMSMLAMKLFGVAITGYLMSKRQKNVYTCQFNWDEEPKPLDFVLGACHAMDIAFVFHNFDRSDNQIARVDWCKKTRKSREILSRAMMRYIAQFARTGNPNRAGLPVWKPWTKGNANTMIFDTPFYLKSGPPKY